MTIQEAYRKAIQYKIEDLPFISIEIPGKQLFLKEFAVNAKVGLIDSDGIMGDTEHFCINTEMLMSNEWEVVLTNETKGE